MKTIIDYLSFTWRPDELSQVFDVAKTMASLPTLRTLDYDDRGNFNPQTVLSLTGAPDYKAAIRDRLAHTTITETPDMVEADSLSFHQCKQACLAHFGLGFLDAICRGEAIGMAERFEEMLSVPGSVFEVEQVSGGFSGYTEKAKIRINGAQCGLVAWGAANGGCYLSFSGKGTAALDMEKVYALLSGLPGCKLTRVDIAYDDFQGAASVDVAREMVERGDFITRGRPPAYRYIESGQVEASKGVVSGSAPARYKMKATGGRTLEVGSRANGKMIRIYEKGKQLHSEECPNWVRWEVQFGNKDRVIPFAILTNPDAYFVGAYPALEFVAVEEVCTIETNRQKYFLSVETAIENGAIQCGKLINYMRQVMALESAEIISRLTRHLEEFEIPERLWTPVYRPGELAAFHPLTGYGK